MTVELSRQSAYLCVLTDDGTIGDDAIVSNNVSDEWMIAHGSGQSMELLGASAGLLFHGYDMTSENSPWEVGLGFTVAKGKTGFRGAEACQALKGQEKIINVCLDIEHDEMVDGGESLSQGQTQAGTVNSPCYSHRLKKSLALAHLAPEFSKAGTQLSLATSSGSTLSATVVATPIYDSDKIRMHA